MKGFDSYRETQPISACYLKYYNKDLALIGCGVPKPTLPLSFYDTNKNVVISFPVDSITYKTPINLFTGYIESDKYLISVYEDTLSYYKLGDIEFKNIKNSVILDKKETYVKQGGVADEYESSLDKKTN